jgi:predicted NBD/HSP70 family sugar kinase
LIYALGLSAAGVSSVVNELINDGLLQEAEATPVEGRLGRPVVLLELVPSAAYTLGLLLRPEAGKVRIETAWADYAGRVHVLPNPPAFALDSVHSIVSGVRSTLRTLEGAVPDVARIAALTIGTPGVYENDWIRIAPRLRAIEGDEFVAAMRDEVPYPIEFMNDVNLGALSELDQQPRLRELTFAYLFIGSGVGAGLAIQGRLWVGRGQAGEVGQLRITRGGGRRESFEELLSMDTLAEKLERIGLPRDGLDRLAVAAKARDRRALRLVNRYSSDLCDVIQVLEAVLDLDEVILDFPSIPLLDCLRPQVEALIADSPLPVAITTPAMAQSAAVCGAALSSLQLALRKIEQRSKH